MKQAELPKTLREKSLNDVTGSVGQSEVAVPVAIRALLDARGRGVTLHAFTREELQGDWMRKENHFAPCPKVTSPAAHNSSSTASPDACGEISRIPLDYLYLTRNSRAQAR